jgi:hypothetical protein
VNPAFRRFRRTLAEAAGALDERVKTLGEAGCRPADVNAVILCRTGEMSTTQ